MNQKYLFLSLFTALTFFGIASLASAQASNSDIPVGIQYNADGTCIISLPSGTTNGTTVVDAKGENSCVVTTEEKTNEVIIPVIVDVNDVFDEVFPIDPIDPPPADDGTGGGASLIPPPYLMFYVTGGGTRMTIPVGGVAHLYWQVRNIAPNTCYGRSTTMVAGWDGTVKEPTLPMTPGVDATFEALISGLPLGTHVYTLRSCRGIDGSLVPSQSVMIVVGDTDTISDTGTTDTTDTTRTTGTTPAINHGIRWNEQ